jgi:hypothetical protein
MDPGVSAKWTPAFRPTNHRRARRSREPVRMHVPAGLRPDGPRGRGQSADPGEPEARRRSSLRSDAAPGQLDLGASANWTLGAGPLEHSRGPGRRRSRCAVACAGSRLGDGAESTRTRRRRCGMASYRRESRPPTGVRPLSSTEPPERPRSSVPVAVPRAATVPVRRRAGATRRRSAVSAPDDEVAVAWRAPMRGGRSPMTSPRSGACPAGPPPCPVYGRREQADQPAAAPQGFPAAHAPGYRGRR